MNATCATCGQPLSPSAKFCRFCGAPVEAHEEPAAPVRPEAPRTPPPPVVAPAQRDTPPPQNVTPPPPRRQTPWRITALVLLVLAVVGAGAYAATQLTGGESEGTSGPSTNAASTPPTAPPSNKARPADKQRRGTNQGGNAANAPHGQKASPGATSTVPDDWPSGTSAWAVFLGSEKTRSAAQSVVNDELGNPPKANGGVLYSSSYSSLNRGYWVAFVGPFSTLARAKRALPQYCETVPDAYTRFVNGAPSARNPSSEPPFTC
jgi:zinc-ribbon domain/SPOR domain